MSLILPTLAALASGHAAIARERVRFDDNWRFHRGTVEKGEAPELDDSGWRELSLPHDWSIEGAPSRKAPSGGGGGYFPTGVGWYRKAFASRSEWSGKRVVLTFDGVYRNAQVWLNGKKLGAHPYGYTPFSLDLTKHLRADGPNLLAVRVDNSSQPNSRWYSGSGIYRHVWIDAMDPVHVARRGVIITTPEVTGDTATVRVAAAIRNDRDEAPGVCQLEFVCEDPQGQVVASARTQVTPPANGSFEAVEELTVPQPQLWSPDSPHLYRLRIRVIVGDRLADSWDSTFGVRTIRFSPEQGFQLNGRTLELIGCNVHHDNGPLGAAAFDRAEERRVQLLKQAGFNAIRTSHNPPSPAFLAACDQYGMVVMDEAFDGWAEAKMEHDYHEDFNDWAMKDLETMIRRDRNHPCVVMWSIGNEVYERGNAEGIRIAHKLATRTRELDPTRPVTAGINNIGNGGNWTQLDPFFAELDVAGYNYELMRCDDDHNRVPGRVIVCTESFQSDAFRNWAAVQLHSWVTGDFVWTGMDYLGEAAIGYVTPPDVTAVPHWQKDLFPWHGAYCGDIDITGWRKAVSHYRNIVWDRGEKLYLTVRVPTADGRPWNLSQWAMPPALPNWTWPGQIDRALTVEIFSRYDTVRLYLDDKLLGVKPTTREQEFKATFDVPYAPGRLKVAGVKDGREVETQKIETAGDPAQIQLETDRKNIRADGQDLAFIVVEIMDAEGRRRYDANQEIHYTISGPGSIAGIGTADMTSAESYQSNSRRAYQGRALVVVRSTSKPGTITLNASAVGLSSAVATIRSE